MQLVEVAFVATFRSLGVRLEALRNAHAYCQKTFEYEYPFAELRFQTDGVHVFQTYAEFEDEALKQGEALLIATDAGGQLAWGAAVADRLDQFDYEDNLALRWHPRGRQSIILVDPRVAFGAPILGDTGIATWVIKDRVLAGETLSEIEDDFGVDQRLLEQALQI